MTVMDICVCKFCDSECVNTIADNTLSTITLYYVKCYDCDARGPVETSREKAISRWNEVWER